MLNSTTVNAFFDELEKIAQSTLEPPKPMTQRTSPKMDVPMPGAFINKPPKPPIGEKIKSLARRGGVVIKNLENILSKPSAPHRYAGVSYKKDFSGFKYS